MIHLSSARNITISHSEEIHDRTTELNKSLAFPPEFFVFNNIYRLSESSFGISQIFKNNLFVINLLEKV